MKHGLVMLRAIVAAAFCWVLATAVRQADVVHLFSGLRPAWLAASVLCTVIMVSASCRKWQLLLELHGANHSWIRLMRLYLTGYLFTNLLPTSIGGDGVRILYAGRDTGSTATVAVSVFLERGTGLLLLLTLVLVTPWWSPGLVGHPAIQLVMAGALGGWLAFGLFCSGHAVRWLERTAAWWPARWVAAARSFSLRLREAVAVLARDPGVTFRVVGWTLFFSYHELGECAGDLFGPGRGSELGRHYLCVARRHVGRPSAAVSHGQSGLCRGCRRVCLWPGRLFRRRSAGHEPDYPRQVAAAGVGGTLLLVGPHEAVATACSTKRQCLAIEQCRNVNPTVYRPVGLFNLYSAV